MEPTKRRCARCKQYKDFEFFYLNPKTHKYRCYCKECHNEKAREYKIEHPEKVRAANVTRWKKIKGDLKLHTKVVEDRRINLRLRNERSMETHPVFITIPKSHTLVKPEPLVRYLETLLERSTVVELEKKCEIPFGTLYRIFHNQHVSFYLADTICVANNKSVYDLYPEMLD